MAWGLTGLHLRGSSCYFVKIGVGYPKNRVGILTMGPMQAAAAAAAAAAEGGGEGGEEDEEEGEDGGSAVALGMISHYAARPQQLERISLFMFVSTQEVSSRAKRGSMTFNDAGGFTRHVSARSKLAVVRVYPRMSPEAHGGEYFYAMLLLHVPWRNEEQSFPRTSYEALQQQFMHHQPAMQLDHATFADDMAAAAARLAALGSQEHGYGGMAAGGQQLDGLAVEEEARAGGEGDMNEWAALNPGDGELPEGLGEGQGRLDAEDIQGGDAVAAAVRDALASAGRGRMTDAQFEDAQQQLQGEQRNVFDVVRRHIRDTQRAKAAAAAAAAAAAQGAE